MGIFKLRQGGKNVSCPDISKPIMGGIIHESTVLFRAEWRHIYAGWRCAYSQPCHWRGRAAVYWQVWSDVETLSERTSSILYYKANKPEDSDWLVLPVTNFDACFGSSSFSRKYLSKIPKKLMQREKQSYGVSRYKVDLDLLQDRQPDNMLDFLLEILRSGSTPF